MSKTTSFRFESEVVFLGRALQLERAVTYWYTADMTSQVFRANVGIVIVGPDRRVLAFERSDVADAWQLPQGGIDVGEEPIDAALRELQEETGLTSADVRMLGDYPGWLSYELPPQLRRDNAMRGQTQRWFYVMLTAEESHIQLQSYHQEFRQYRWTSLADLAAHAVSFRREVYRQLADHLDGLPLDA